MHQPAVIKCNFNLKSTLNVASINYGRGFRCFNNLFGLRFAPCMQGECAALSLQARALQCSWLSEYWPMSTQGKCDCSEFPRRSFSENSKTLRQGTRAQSGKTDLRNTTYGNRANILTESRLS